MIPASRLNNYYLRTLRVSIYVFEEGWGSARKRPQPSSEFVAGYDGGLVAPGLSHM